jgi:hypothetical protein
MRISALCLLCLTVVPTRSWAGDGIHPLTGPAWSFETHQVGAELSFVRAAGDVNGDGFGDVIAGAPSFDTNHVDAGRAWLFLGSASGISTTAAWQSSGPDQVGARFGSSVSTAGDVDGDGFDDVLITARGFDAPLVDAGLVQLYRGGANGLATSPSWTFVGTQAGLQITSAAYAGDLNHDGFDDVVVGAIDPSSAGHVYLFFGRATGLTAAPNWTLDGVQLGLGIGAELGSAVASAGDVNADGFDDFLVGAALAPDPALARGQVWLFRGSSTLPSTTPAWTASGAAVRDELGAQGNFGAAGDVNGDGFADVVVGVGGAGPDDHGEVRIFSGGPSGLSIAPLMTLVGSQALARFGEGCSAAGDVNGDGFADVWIGSPGFANAGGVVGRVELHLGSATGVEPLPVTSFDGSNFGAAAASRLGACVAPVGDVDGDGFADVGFVAPLFDDPEVDAGRAWVFTGCARGISTTYSWVVARPQLSFFGDALDGAGDVDGDGFDDLIVGAYGTNTAEVFRGGPAGLSTVSSWTLTAPPAQQWFGFSVATAGDVDGDGFADVIVGAPAAFGASVLPGSAFLYRGGPLGLSTSPAWSFSGGQIQAWFGYTVASAGDVNGDGFADVTIDAPMYDVGGATDAGRVFLFLGSSSGLSASPAWTRDGTFMNARAHAPVHKIGDVNGDGFDDILVVNLAHPTPTTAINVGELFLGSPAGLAASPDSTIALDTMATVSGAGDVNGDGYDDILVSAPARVFLGGPAGLATTPVWTYTSPANYLSRVAGIGDINGDGFGDIATADPDAGFPYWAGQAWVFLGGPAGPSSTPHWSRSGYDAPLFGGDCWLGAALASAGDVNGDGIDDFAIGAGSLQIEDYPQCRALACYGNYGGGPAFTPEQRRTDDTSKIAPDGKSDTTSTFRGRVEPKCPSGFASTSAGRDDVRLEWEVKEQRVPFDGAGVQHGPDVDTGVVGTHVVFSQAVGGLTQGRTYHWRARVAGRDPIFAHSRWLSAPTLVSTETMLRTFRDCNGNAIPDPSDIANGTSSDTNGDGLPDECQGSIAAFCFGDGSGTPCPCGNAGASGHGCSNSANAAGARLASSGVPSAAHDTLVLHGVGMTPTSSVLYFQGTAGTAGGAGATFGDGLRCVGGSVVRLGVEHNAGGGSTYPGTPGDASISVKGAIPVGGGVTRRYQAWFRDAAAFCTSSAFNLTNGLSVDWAP